MEDLDLLDLPVGQSGDLLEMILRFLFNSFFIWIIIHKLYFPKSRRIDYYFTFSIISVSIFFLIFLLGSVKIKVGFALGLFAIFGIIRYRTESMSVREMTYLFVIIALSVINALAVTITPFELLVTNLIFVVSIAIGEKLPGIKHLSDKLVKYDRIDLIVPERRAELIEDLNKRLGLNVEKVEVGGVDFLRDTAMLKVYYVESSDTSNSVNKLLNLPKEQL
jgi:hypothetical protein